MTVYKNYNVIAFKSCIQIFTVYAIFHYRGFHYFFLDLTLLIMAILVWKDRKLQLLPNQYFESIGFGWNCPIKLFVHRPYVTKAYSCIQNQYICRRIETGVGKLVVLKVFAIKLKYLRAVFYGFMGKTNK